MVCKNCNNRINQKRCPICGYDNSYRISIATVLSILCIVAVVFLTVALLAMSINGMGDAGDNAAFGFAMLTSAGAVLFFGGGAFVYYLIVLFVSIICDINVKKDYRIVQNIVVFLFLLIPILIGLVLFLKIVYG